MTVETGDVPVAETEPVVEEPTDPQVDEPVAEPTTTATTAAPKPAPPAGEWKPPTRAEHDALARELRLAVKEAKERKAKIAEMEAANATESERAVMKAREEGAAERDATWKPAVVEARAETALALAGCTDPDRQKRMLRLLDRSLVELDDQGRVVGGLTEQIDVIKGEFPEAFGAGAVKIPSARDVNAGNKKAPAKPQTANEQLVARLTGGKPN